MRAKPHITLIPALLVTLCLLWTPGCGRRPPRKRVEHRFSRDDRVLLMVPYGLPQEAGARSVRFGLAAVREAEFYAKDPAGDGFIHIDAGGRVVHNGSTWGRLEAAGELLLTPESWVLFVDDTPVDQDLRGWSVYWAARHEVKPQTDSVVHPRVALADGFMRHELRDETCRVSAGTWQLAQRGGGMPRNLGEAYDSSFQRAVNPFAAQGSDDGVLTYGAGEDWRHYHAEARFYFGVPRTGKVVDVNTVPLDTDMLVVQGELSGNQVGFGWLGAEQTFALVTRTDAGDWSVEWRHQGGRPPLTNWVKLGLRVRAGYVAEALLDDASVAACRTGAQISGPFHVIAGRALMEVDDIRAWSLPAEPDKGGSLYVKSRHFASKSHKQRADPVQFEQWAESTGAFRRMRIPVPEENVRKAVITATMPLMGDFFYESEPYAEGIGGLPSGLYEFSLYTAGSEKLDIRAQRPAFSLRAERTKEGWSVPALTPDSWPAGHREAALRLERTAAGGHRVAVQVVDGRVPVSQAIAGPVHLSIARIGLNNSYVYFPSPKHHIVTCRNLFHDLFEHGPADWSWIEGAFRMDARWACQDQWNFMSCGSPGVPYMTSKRRFFGDQVHEYYMSLRPVYPWDAGDTSFTYDADADRANKFPIFVAHDGWYNRRDLNFSFCTDGRNPLSGYSVVFGGDDNRETRLLRRGETVARATGWGFLFGTSDNRVDIHWNWWKFTVRKRGSRLSIQLNDREMFDYVDTEPVRGGHIGFWTIRNGFALARTVSMAEDVEWRPDVLYVPNDTAGSVWHSLLEDSVRLSVDETGAMTTVTHNVGGGFHGVRYTPETPVDLAKTPVLELPLVLDASTCLNVHLYIGGRSCLLRVNAPTEGTKSLLTPEFEKGECFQLPTLSEFRLNLRHLLGSANPEDGVLRINLAQRLAKLRRPHPEPHLTTITLGNTSNEDYLLAGSKGRNVAGSSYQVGVPGFTAE